MTHHLRVTIEVGPKGKQVVAVAKGKLKAEIRKMKAQRFSVVQQCSFQLSAFCFLFSLAPVAALAGMASAFAATSAVDVVEQYPGVGSTDFWGISFAFSSIDQQAMPDEALARELTLLQACWAFFDAVRSRVSAELQRGPRGGGRDRDQIVRHTLAAELDWAKKLGVHTPLDALLTDVGLRTHRDAYCDAIRALHAQGKLARTWPLRYLIRHTAFHTLDHAWEMEDKDLTSIVGV
ncbi:MAG: hypothetical protein WCI67_14235 [Chloroflexales bacterium]